MLRGMARWWSRLGLVVLLIGCGKLAPKERAPATRPTGSGGTAPTMEGGEEAGGASSDPTAATGGAAARGGGSTSAGSGGRSGGPASPYEPTNTDVPVEGDGTLAGGSVEGGLGDGWDFCRSKHPGLVTAPVELSPYDGMRYLGFDSTLACPDCDEYRADLQVLFWFDAPIPAGATRYLYFDVANYGVKPPTGTLVFGSVRAPSMDVCSSSEVLANIPLEALAISGEWQTRCVAITPEVEFSTFGLYVADGTFQIGLDALRFGPPCRATPP